MSTAPIDSVFENTPKKPPPAGKIKTALCVIWVLYFVPAPFVAAYFNWVYAKENGFVAWLSFGQIVPTAQAVIWPYHAVKPLLANKWSDEEKANLAYFKRSIVTTQKASTMVEGIVKKEGTDPAEKRRAIEIFEEAVNQCNQVRDDVLAKIHPDCPRAYRDYYQAPIERLLAMLKSRQFDESEMAAIARLCEKWDIWTEDHKVDLERIPKELPDCVIAQENEAERPFRQMESKILTAKTVQASGEMEFRGGKSEGKLQVALLFAETNKARLKLTVEAPGREQVMSLISDGTKMVLSMNQPEKTRERMPARDLSRSLGVGLSRLGLSIGMHEFQRGSGMPVGGKGDPEDQMPLAEFKLRPPEKVGVRDAKVITFRTATSGQKNMTVTLWIDAETHLPLKRVMAAETEKAQMTETYREFRLNSRVEPNSFKLPE